MVNTARVLLVDDLRENLEVLEALLSGPGVELVSAQNGEQALELLLAHEFAAAVLDVQMPGMDGFELAELMRGTQRTRHVPIIFVTAGTHDMRRIFRGYEAGAVDFLHKPLDPPVLRGKVAVFVELYRQRLQLATQLDALRAALRLNETFTAVLGHDLRTPLGAVVNASEVLLRGSNSPMVTLAAARIRQSADRMARMIEQLLDLAMLRSGRLQLQPEPANLMSVCQALSDELDPVGLEGPPRERRIRVDLRGDPHGTFDVDRIGQVISNLLGNALQHGDPMAPVQLLVDGSDPGTLVVSVHNAGAMQRTDAGMNGSAVHFKGQDDASGPLAERRLGLGLQIAEHFVLAHRGSMHCHTGADEGTTFEIRLPRGTHTDDDGGGAVSPASPVIS
jgi:two-component system, sensor histidine kinase and response regulator